MENTIVHVAFKQAHPVEDEMLTAIKDTIYSFAGRITTAATFGVLSMVEHDLKRELL